MPHARQDPPALGKRLSAQRGASAVEFAIIAPVFFMLVFGGISGAIAFDRNNTMTHAAREAARSGATLATNGVTQVPDAWFEQIASWAEDAANGHLDSGVPGRYICVAYVGYASQQSSGNDWTRRRVVDGATVTFTNGALTNPDSWCFDDGRGSDGSERRVQVQVGRDTEFSVVFWTQNVGLRADGVSRFEAVTSS